VDDGGAGARPDGERALADQLADVEDRQDLAAVGEDTGEEGDG
jgi:hypothetical protein